MKNKRQTICTPVHSYACNVHVKIENSFFSTYISSSSPLFRAFLAMHWKASSTLIPSLAEVSKYGIFPFDAHQARAFFSETWKTNRKLHVEFDHKWYLTPMREVERAIISKKDIPLYYFHHLHRSCSLEQQMENFLDLRDLPAEGFAYHHHNCNFFSFHLRSHRGICKWSNLLKSLEIQMANLNKEFFSPVVKVVKWLHWINIIYKNTAISTTVEGNTKALESFLASRIPDLIKQKDRLN